MSWTHAICGPCWNAKPENATRQTDESGDGPNERCCWCGRFTARGIYLREDPVSLPHCHGHPSTPEIADQTDDDSIGVEIEGARMWFAVTVLEPVT